MGLFKKIAVEAAKKAVEYVAMDAISGNNKVANQIISDIKNSNDEKIVEKACNRALFRIKQFSSIDDIDTQTIVVNQDGDFYYMMNAEERMFVFVVQMHGIHQLIYMIELDCICL